MQSQPEGEGRIKSVIHKDMTVSSKSSCELSHPSWSTQPPHTKIPTSRALAVPGAVMIRKLGLK